MKIGVGPYLSPKLSALLSLALINLSGDAVWTIAQMSKDFGQSGSEICQSLLVKGRGPVLTISIGF